MILTCNNCDTNFRVADDAIGEKGRFVRCSKCGYEWLAKITDAIETMSIHEVTQKEESLDRRVNPKPDKISVHEKNNVREFRTKSNVWPYFIIILLISFVLISVVYMSQIIATIPALEPLYEKVGLYDNKNLILDYSKATQTENTVKIEVNVKNPTQKVKKINHMRVSFYDKDMRKLEDVIFTKRIPINPQETLLFRKKINVTNNNVFYVSLEIIGHWNLKIANYVIAKQLIRIDSTKSAQLKTSAETIESTQG